MKQSHVLALVAIAVVIFFVMRKKNITEPFAGAMTTRTLDSQKDIATFPQWMVDSYPRATLPTDPFYSYGPNGKSKLPPRMMSQGQYDKIRGAQPPLDVQAVPPQPVNEEPDNYLSLNQYGHPEYDTLVTGGALPEPGLQGMNQEQIDAAIYDKYLKNLEYIEPQEMLPNDSMAGNTFGQLLSDPDTFVFDRQIFANQKSRLWAGADRFRGDLDIMPHNLGWFQVSVLPHRDLMPGAIGGTGSQIASDYSVENSNDPTMGSTVINNRQFGPDVCMRRIP